ncbi:hypothetical protein ACFL20_12285 [Spirochaetota bacterium]
MGPLITETLRQKNLRIIDELKKKNYKFKVKIQEIMKYKIAEITGVKVPRNIRRQAKVQFSFGDQQWKKFFNKHMEKRSKSDIERERRSGDGQ